MPIEWLFQESFTYLLPVLPKPFVVIGNTKAQPGSESDGVTDVRVTTYLFTYEWSNDVRVIYSILLAYGVLKPFPVGLTESNELVSNYLAFFYIKQLNE